MTRLVLTKGVQEYRKAILLSLNPNDIALEIGFAWGTTSNLIANRLTSLNCENNLFNLANQFIAIDKSPSYLSAIKSYPSINFYQYDCFDINSVLELKLQFNKIFIDISGCRDIYSYLKVINMYEAIFKPEIMVIMSSKLKRFVAKCEVFDY